MEQRREGYNFPAFNNNISRIKTDKFNSFIVTNHVIVYKQKLVPIGPNTKWKQPLSTYFCSEQNLFKKNFADVNFSSSRNA